METIAASAPTEKVQTLSGEAPSLLASLTEKPPLTYSGIPPLDAKDPQVLRRIIELYHVKIVKEDRNILALFQAFVGAASGRKLVVVIKAVTGSGKSGMAKAVLAPFKKLGLVIEFSRITPTYLEYLGLSQLKPRDKEEDKDTSGKLVFKVDLPTPILYIDEMKGAQQASQSIKLIYSEGRLILGTVIRGRPVEIQLGGVKVVVTTTTNAAFEDPELENRLFPLQVDESAVQTGLVLDKQAAEGESLEEEDEDDDTWLQSREVRTIADFLNQLKPVKVSIPYAKEVADCFPRKNVIERREYPKVKRILRNLACIHQYQRPKVRSGEKLVAGIAADPVDLDYVKWMGLPAIKESLTGISAKEQEILDTLENDAPDTGVTQGPLGEVKNAKGWTVQQIVKHLGLSRRKEDVVRKSVKRLMDDGYVLEDQEGRPYRYVLTGLQNEALEINLKQYAGSGLKEWADRKGYVITEMPILTPVFNDPSIDNSATSPLGIETRQLPPDKLEARGDWQSPQEMGSAKQTQQGLPGNGNVAMLKAAGVGQVTTLVVTDVEVVTSSTLRNEREIGSGDNGDDLDDVFNKYPPPSSPSDSEDRIDPALVSDFLLRTVIPREEQIQKYAVLPKIIFHVNQRFGPNAEHLVPQIINRLLKEGRIIEAPFRRCYKLALTGPRPSQKAEQQ